MLTSQPYLLRETSILFASVEFWRLEPLRFYTETS